MDHLPRMSSSATGVGMSIGESSSNGLLDLVAAADFFNASALRSAICSLIDRPAPCEDAGDGGPAEMGDIGDFAREGVAEGFSFGAETLVLNVGAASPRVGRLGVVGPA